MRSPFTKREFGSFAGVLRPKARDGYADESDALGRREDGPDQAKGEQGKMSPLESLFSPNAQRESNENPGQHWN